MLTKSVKVHDDTHRVLKEMKAERRSKSVDQVIREMIREATGSPVEKIASKRKGDELTAFMEG